MGLALLMGLVTLFLSSKNWHWTQILLVTCILFAATVVLYMATETASMHQELRSGIPRLEKQLATLEQQNELLLKGSDDQKGIRELDHRLQIVFRERGRVWRQVQPTGQIDNQGRIQVEILNPQPHGLDQDAIVFAFETGPPNNDSPANGPQYLDEFRVVSVEANGVTLESVHLLLDPRKRELLARSKGPWSLYETMPADRHKLFANYTDEELQQMLPAATVEEYIRHGKPANDDDDQWHVIGLDENDQRVAENIDQAVKKLYDRTLRDYAYLFSDLARQHVVMLAEIRSVSEDNKRIETALKSAEELSAFRTEESENLAQDLNGMQQDRAAIEKHRDQLTQVLAHAKSRIDDLLTKNIEMANQYTEIQLSQMKTINALAPKPAGPVLTGR
ncbi:MAG TPA: hypothetical protein DHW22_01105 [Planctomycetaceae bacterium]|nr:hypothetical protein [Planctomycetaceae bacterium]